MSLLNGIFELESSKCPKMEKDRKSIKKTLLEANFIKKNKQL